MPNPGPLSEAQKKLVKSTAPVLEQHGGEITKRFYKQMLEKNPELKNIFNHSKQQVRLVGQIHGFLLAHKLCRGVIRPKPWLGLSMPMPQISMTSHRSFL